MPMATPTLETEKPWLAEGANKRAAVQEMFAGIAPKYDRLNGIMSLSRHHRWRALAVAKAQLREGDSALDVCCGTGDFLAPLRQAVGPKGQVVGIDFCLPMLDEARRKHVPGSLVQGDGGRLPILSSSVNAVTVGWGIRNVPDIDETHREIFRVLKLGGRFVSVDMALPRNPVLRAGSQLVCGRLLPVLGSLFGLKTAYTYLPKSTEKFLGREGLKASMEAAGFRDVGWQDFMFGNICMHWGVKP
ncbi:MAG TPA: ubiquinone/menaquinone biosynthesis methyltransferase [Fimbriimonadaceae bacterium]|nr:ubiquinone/menaquinone biosynthesis methyltransferase [Fimbriimonadaceae bacterium]